MPDHPPRILLVGHCTPDAYAIRSAVTSLIPGAAVAFVRDQASLDEALPNSHLLLVNRKLDGMFEAKDGVALIQSLSSRTPAPRTMLISNLDDAQAAARSAGALPGFGKRDLYSDDTKAKLKHALSLT